MHNSIILFIEYYLNLKLSFFFLSFFIHFLFKYISVCNIKIFCTLTIIYLLKLIWLFWPRQFLTSIWFCCHIVVCLLCQLPLNLFFSIFLIWLNYFKAKICWKFLVFPTRKNICIDYMYMVSMPQYSWNTAKVGIKHQSINQSMFSHII
jgi:hypothetical protein